MSNNLVSVFNDHFNEFVNDIQSVFPEDHDILVAKNSFLAIKKANPKLIVKIWHLYIINKYKTQIDNGDIRFFIEKDYSQDVSNAEYSDKIMEAINRLRDPIKNMDVDNQLKTMKYIQNLTKLALLIPN